MLQQERRSQSLRRSVVHQTQNNTLATSATNYKVFRKASQHSETNRSFARLLSQLKEKLQETRLLTHVSDSPTRKEIRQRLREMQNTLERNETTLLPREELQNIGRKMQSLNAQIQQYEEQSKQTTQAWKATPGAQTQHIRHPVEGIFQQYRNRQLRVRTLTKNQQQQKNNSPIKKNFEQMRSPEDKVLFIDMLQQNEELKQRQLQARRRFAHRNLVSRKPGFQHFKQIERLQQIRAAAVKPTNALSLQQLHNTINVMESALDNEEFERNDSQGTENEKGNYNFYTLQRGEASIPTHQSLDLSIDKSIAVSNYSNNNNKYDDSAPFKSNTSLNRFNMYGELPQPMSGLSSYYFTEEGKRISYVRYTCHNSLHNSFAFAAAATATTSSSTETMQHHQQNNLHQSLTTSGEEQFEGRKTDKDFFLRYVHQNRRPPYFYYQCQQEQQQRNALQQQENNRNEFAISDYHTGNRAKTYSNESYQVGLEPQRLQESLREDQQQQDQITQQQCVKLKIDVGVSTLTTPVPTTARLEGRRKKSQATLQKKEFNHHFQHDAPRLRCNQTHFCDEKQIVRLGERLLERVCNCDVDRLERVRRLSQNSLASALDENVFTQKPSEGEYFESILFPDATLIRDD